MTTAIISNTADLVGKPLTGWWGEGESGRGSSYTHKMTRAQVLNNVS